MSVDVYTHMTWLYKALEAAERLDEITPLITGQLQRKLGIGYGQAAVIMDLFEELGIVSRSNAAGDPRLPLISPREAAFTVIRHLYAELPDNETDAIPSHNTSDFSSESDKTPDIGPLGLIECLFTEEDDDESDSCFILFQEETQRTPTVHTAQDICLSPADYLRKAVEVACSRERIGTSPLQRTLRIGYGRAAALMDRMEELGIVGPDPCDKTGREVLLSLEEAMPLANAWILSVGLSETVDPPLQDDKPPVFTDNENPILYGNAIEALKNKTQISISGLGREMGINHLRAMGVMSWLVEQGIVSAEIGIRRNQEILVSHEEAHERLENWTRKRLGK